MWKKIHVCICKKKKIKYRYYDINYYNIVTIKLAFQKNVWFGNIKCDCLNYKCSYIYDDDYNKYVFNYI